jgi:hypothetical protein
MTEVEVWRVRAKEGSTVGLFVDCDQITEAAVSHIPTDGPHMQREPSGFSTLTLTFQHGYWPEWREIPPVKAPEKGVGQ